MKLERLTKVSPNGLNDNTCCRASLHPHHTSFKKVLHCVINGYCTTYRQHVSAQKADLSCATSLLRIQTRIAQQTNQSMNICTQGQAAAGP